MSSSDERPSVTVTSGDLLASTTQTLVNTVNCVGIMGKGIALAFKRRYPVMYEDYVRRCDRGEVRLGEPYLYRAGERLIINFPTKNHWRAVSRLTDIVAGLEYLEAHYREWGVTSIAVPPLGCGNGQLEWDVVGPTLFRYLTRLEIPVELYAPHSESRAPVQLSLDSSEEDALPSRERFVEPEWVAVMAILDKLQRRPHHWPVGRVLFQKLVYFATQAGIPTGLTFAAGSYGPYSEGLKRRLGRLQNNGLAMEQQRGNMLEVRVGPTYRDAVATFREHMEPWRTAVERTFDLMTRMNTSTAEVAASVHFVANDLGERLGRRPTALEVVEGVERWKVRRNPPLERDTILDALVVLALQGWIDVELDEELVPVVEALVLT